MVSENLFLVPPWHVLLHGNVLFIRLSLLLDSKLPTDKDCIIFYPVPAQCHLLGILSKRLTTQKSLRPRFPSTTSWGDKAIPGQILTLCHGRRECHSLTQPEASVPGPMPGTVGQGGNNLAYAPGELLVQLGRREVTGSRTMLGGEHRAEGKSFLPATGLWTDLIFRG